MSESVGKMGRWAGFVACIGSFFWGVDRMVHSDHGWYWFVPLLLPLIAFVQMEAEREDTLAYGAGPKSLPARAFRALLLTLACVLSIVAGFAMNRSGDPWWVFAPLLLPLIVMIPGVLKRTEQLDEAGARRNALKRPQREKRDRLQSAESGPSTSSLLRRLMVGAAVLAALALAWYVGGYYLLVALLS